VEDDCTQGADQHDFSIQNSGFRLVWGQSDGGLVIIFLNGPRSTGTLPVSSHGTGSGSIEKLRSRKMKVKSSFNKIIGTGTFLKENIN